MKESNKNRTKRLEAESVKRRLNDLDGVTSRLEVPSEKFVAQPIKTDTTIGMVLAICLVLAYFII